MKLNDFSLLTFLDTLKYTGFTVMSFVPRSQRLFFTALAALLVTAAVLITTQRFNSVQYTTSKASYETPAMEEDIYSESNMYYQDEMGQEPVYSY